MPYPLGHGGLTLTTVRIEEFLSVMSSKISKTKYFYLKIFININIRNKKESVEY